MAAPVIPCDSCGSPIPDSDLEAGAAITLLGKRYCGACKTEAIQSVSLEDLADKPAAKPAARASAAKPAAPKPLPPKPAAPGPTPLPPPTKSAAVRPAAPEPAPSRLSRAASVKRLPAASGAPSRKPLIVGLSAAAGALVVAAAVFAFKGSGTPPPAKPPASSSGTGTGPAPTPDRDSAAREAFQKVENLTHRAGVSNDLILAAVEKAKAVCRGTEWEKRLEDIRAKAGHDKEMDDSARDLTPLIDEIKGLVSTDPEFKRYAEVQPKFQLALEMAARTNSARMPEIRALQKEYNGRYERAAEPLYNEINEAATALADERRYDDAIKKIDAFPAWLRQSGAWLSLEKLRKDIERRKKK